MTTLPSSARQFFDQKYAANPDPWGFASSSYELTRYATLLRALEGRRFRHAFEPGCSIGVLTSALATICDRIDALDISARAIELAKARCGHLPNVTFHVGELPDALPAGPFDLLVLSEVAYYFEAPQLRLLADKLCATVEPGGTVIAGSWLGSSPEHSISGDLAHDILRETVGLELIHSERHDDFRLDMWTRITSPAVESVTSPVPGSVL